MTKIIFVRHGQTEWNVLGRYQGQTDVALSPLGIEQAEKLAAHFPVDKIEAVYSSDLARAMKTASCVADRFGLTGRGYLRPGYHADVTVFDPRTAEEWVGKQGADGKKFAEAFASFGVNSKMSRAEQIARAYKVDGVPMVVVDGRYVVKGEAFKDVLRNADLLIEKIRAERAGKKK